MWSSQSLPLQDIKSYHPSFRVESRLHETLWKHTFTESDITLEIFSLCCQLEFLCKRHYTKVKGGIHDSHKLEYENKFKPHARVEFLKMNELLMYLPAPQPTFQDFLKEKEWINYFRNCGLIFKVLASLISMYKSLRYQHAIAEIGPPLDSYKNQVEEMFGEIKQSLNVESGQIPHLSMDEKLRLDTVTSSLMDHVQNFREDLIQPMASVISFIQEYA